GSPRRATSYKAGGEFRLIKPGSSQPKRGSAQRISRAGHPEPCIIQVLFNLWYRDFNHTPAYDNNLPQVDHIFPQSALKRVKVENPKTGRKDVMKYRDAERNQLANCMLLSREENGAGGKGDTSPEDWFRDKSEDYLQRHLIPDDPPLWRLERFEDFIAARKKLIRERFSYLLVSTA
ncbi:MAG: HNH endonuclease, partial [Acidobacteria bacterium]|nr:HNH endonuclease [Acidobacteriota bacterium]